MTEPTNVPANVQSPKPPLPTTISGSLDPHSDSFRNVDYTPRNTDASSAKESVPWWRIFTGSKKENDPMKTEDIVEVLSRHSSRGLMSVGSQELPPLPPLSPRAKLAANSRQVGLPTVTLIPASGNTPPNSARELQTDTPPQPTVEAPVDANVEGEGMQTTEVGEVTETTPLTTGAIEVTEIAPLTTDTVLPKADEDEKDTPENDNRDEVTTDPVSTAATGNAVATETHQMTETAPVEIKGTSAEVKKEGTDELPTATLRTSQTMAKSNPASRSFIRRMFTFGAMPGSGTSNEPDQVHTRDLPSTMVADIKTEVPDVSKQIPHEEKSNLEGPSQSVEIVETIEETPIPIATKHVRGTSDLTREELEELKSTFITEMTAKGIDVGGKYMKSSQDFDSALMFLLDLHTFGATYDTSVKMEDVLQRKYGVDHAVVCEFSEAAATESESKHTDVPAIEDEPRESSSGEGSYETGLDTAKDSVNPLKAEAHMTVAVEPVPENQSEGLRSESKDETKPLVQSNETKSDADQPPAIPSYRDETADTTERMKCSFCFCLSPTKK